MMLTFYRAKTKNIYILTNQHIIQIQISVINMKSGHREAILSEISITRLENRVPARGKSKFSVAQVGTQTSSVQ